MMKSLKNPMGMILIGSLTLSPRLAMGLDPAQYQESLKLLQESQRSTQQRLRSLGVKSRSHFLGAAPFKPDEEESEPEEKRPLFILHDDGKRLQAEAGKYLFGTVYNQLVVGSEDVPVTVKVDGDQGLFSGLKVLGKARPSSTEGRLAIQFDRLVTRGGKVIPIKGMAEDSAGAFGLEAQVFSSKAWAVAGAMAGSFVSGLASSQQTLSASPFGFSQPQTTGRNALLQGIAQTAADQSKRLIDNATQEKPVLVVNEGTQVTLYLDEEVRF